MNNLDKQYQELLQDILNNGVEKTDRTGTGIISVFGRQIRHKMSEGFPLLTTKKMAWKSIVTELLWFLRGDTNIKYLVDNDCHIWDGDAYKNYSSYVTQEWEDGYINELEQDNLIVVNSKDDENVSYRKLTQEQFINKIKTDDEFAKQWGELGPIYGKQWRDWETYNNDQSPWINIDQISNLISELKTNPDSRRLMVNAWNVGDLEQMVLPPCHYGFQVYTRELHKNRGWERYDLLTKRISERELQEKYKKDERAKWLGFCKFKLEDANYICDLENIPTRAISLMWNQRSVDTFLGLPFNIASYALLLEIIAKEVNMIPDELIGNLGDVHLYKNHIEQAKEQIGRELTLEERMSWWFKNKKPNRDVCDSIDAESDYAKGVYFDSAGVPKRTKEPMKLPKLIINENNKLRIGGGIFTYDNKDFTLENYESHPAIKAPLSN